MKNKHIQNLVLSGVLLALGMVLPLATAQIKEIGDTLLPMHFPVLLCGLVCGWKYGLAVGIILPFLRAVTVGMPPLYPNAVWMSLELATYGGVIGFLYLTFRKKQMWWLYVCLIISMVSGRIVWGIAKTILLGVAGKAFTLQVFIAGGIIDALPGIVLQLILIPAIIRLKDVLLERSGK